MTNINTRAVAALLLFGLLGASLITGAGTAAVSAQTNHPVYGASLKVLPLCMTVSRKERKLHITLIHGVRHVRYTFALLPLFGNGRLVGPTMGGHRADSTGAASFTFPAPNHRRDRGVWQVTATRKLSSHRFKLAAIAHFKVRRGRCHQG